MRHAWLICALSLIAVVAHAQTGTAVASLDRDHVAFGETVTLNIDVGSSRPVQPDLSALAQDFSVVGLSAHQTASNNNGMGQLRTVIGIALRPAREGEITVPAITVGNAVTQPLKLTVDATPDAPADAANRPAFMESVIEPARGYVGQQFNYTERLYLDLGLGLADGHLGDPSVEGAEMRMVGQEANYERIANGRRYRVVEHHYAIIPQRAGPLEIKPPSFEGTAIDPTDVNSFLGGGRPISAVAQPQRIDVLDRPSGASEGAWLPARSLTLTLEGFPADGRARVGQPITLGMRLDAIGLPFEALPALSMPKLEGADVYPDKAVTGTSTNGPWITGRRQQGFAVVPTRAGTLHIPETTLHWWNVVTDKPETATIPARDIEVMPGAAGATTAPATATPAAGPVAAPAGTPPPAPVSTGGSVWRWIAAGAILLWLCTLAGWLLWARRHRRPTLDASAGASVEPRRPGPAREHFLKVASGDDPISTERALLAWARVVRHDIRSLGDLSVALHPGPQRDAIGSFQRARFGHGSLDPAAFRDAFTGGFEWAPVAGTDDDGGLPPLYPR